MRHPYSNYRDSGVESLGEIPEHWELRQLGRMGSFFKGGGGTKEDEVDNGIPCVRYGDLYTQHQFLIRGTRAGIGHDSVERYRQLQYGDVLFAGSGETIDEIGKSAVNLIEGPAYCGGDVIVFRPSIEVDATFLGYATDSRAAISQKACMGRGVTVMHIYSSELKYMRQAIEEGFILDVLSNYIDYDSYFRLVRQAEDDKDFPKRRTVRALAKFITLHEYNLAQKTEVVIEHFRNQVKHRIGGKAKAMVVTSSRLHAVRYMLAFQSYIAERGYADVDRFGTDFTESERLFLQQVQHDAINKEEIRRTAQANPFDKFSLGVRPQLQEMMIERMADNDALVTRALNDPEFQEIVFAGLLQAIFDAVTNQSQQAALDD